MHYSSVPLPPPGMDCSQPFTPIVHSPITDIATRRRQPMTLHRLPLLYRTSDWLPMKVPQKRRKKKQRKSNLSLGRVWEKDSSLDTISL